MKVALVGCGGIGHHHATMIRNCRLDVVLCADTVPAAAKKLAAVCGAKAVPVDGWSKRATKLGVDIVAITTPTPTHSPLIKQAAQAGMHVFCEKPFGRTIAQCRDALRAVDKAGVKLFVGHVVRYFQEFEAMRAQIEAGKIGEPGYAKLYRGGLFPGPKGSWFHDYAQSGGVTFDSMLHDLDWARYAFGEPERIFCRALQRSEPCMVDYAQATMRMKSGLIAAVTGTWAHPSGFRVKAEVCGSNGMIQYDSGETAISSQMRATGKGPSMVIPMSADAVSPYQLEWEDFLVWIREDREPKVLPEDGLRAVEMGLAALKSAETGRPVGL